MNPREFLIGEAREWLVRSRADIQACAAHFRWNPRSRAVPRSAMRRKDAEGTSDLAPDTVPLRLTNWTC
jgi:hypothetical protein